MSQFSVISGEVAKVREDELKDSKKNLDKNVPKAGNHASLKKSKGGGGFKRVKKVPPISKESAFSRYHKN